MSLKRTILVEAGLVCVAVICSWLAFEYSAAGGLIIIFLAAMFYLGYGSGSPRRAFYWGLVIGTLNAAINLRFFYNIFGVGAVALWAILGVWMGCFTWLSRRSRDLYGVHAQWLIPWFWVGFEYFRSELYPLKFSWLAPGMALSDPFWQPLAGFGYYGFSLLVMIGCAGLSFAYLRKKAMIPMVVIGLLGVGYVLFPSASSPSVSGPYVAGIQFEFVNEDQVLRGLDKVLKHHADTEIVVLSEYAFQGPVPPAVLAWCQQNKRYLIAGGKEVTGAGSNDFRNTIFVIDPAGSIVHRQVKSVPIQFFNDGAPATHQSLWHSPWGPIGLAVCYDLSYSRVIDRLVDAGAVALIIPTMDVQEWGESEHRLHAKIPYVRAREYRIPIVRIASSGISQLVNAGGVTLDSAPFPGPARVLGGRLELSPAVAGVPVLRRFCLPSLVVTLSMICWIMTARFRTSKRRG